MMKPLFLLFGALAAYSQQVTISDTLTNAVGGSLYTGRITVTLNSPASAQPLTYGTTSLAGWQYVLCIGVTGSDCSAQAAAGVVLIPLYSNSTITPGGTSYTARYAPAKGSAWSETWVVAPANTKLYEIRSTVVPSPSVTFALSQITGSGATAGQYLRWSGSAWAPYTLAPLTDPTTTTGDLIYRSSGGALTRLGIGSSGQVLTVSGGLPSWATGGGAVSSVFGRTGAVTATAGDYTTAQVTESGNLYYTDARARAAITGTAPVSVAAGVVSCPTCVVTSGSYADPEWVTSISGSKVSGAVSSATALATARTIAGVSFDGTANIAISSTGLSDTANLARLNAGQSYSAGAKQTFAPSATTAGINVGVRASAPSTPAQGDVYFDSTLTRKGVYDGTQWRYELYAPTGTGVMQWNGSVITAGALAYSSLTGTPSLAAIATSGSASDLATGTVPTARLGTGTASSTTFLRGDGTWATPAGSGSVTSVSTTTGLLSVSNPTTTPSIDVTGTSGGIPYFSTTSTLASSAALDAGALVVGGGAGAAPSILANSSVPNAGELRISTTPTASATRSVMTLGNAIVGGASTGTYYAANAPSGNQSDLLNLQVNNASVFRVGYLGTLAMSAGITINRSSLTDVLNSNSGASAGLRITGSSGTGSGNQLTLRGTSGGTASDQLRINGDSKAVMIGQTVATTGLSSMSLYVSDTTASTGVTRLSIQEGAGQGSTNGFEYRLNSGTANGGTLVWSISQGGEPTWGSTTEGTCSATLRGQVVMVQGGAGAKDTFRICAKDAADAYAWRTIY